MRLSTLMYWISLDYVVPVHVTEQWLKLEITTFNLTCAEHWLRDVAEAGTYIHKKQSLPYLYI